MRESIKALPFAVTGLSSTLGEIIPIETFAERLKIPDRKRPGQVLSGAFLQELLGLRTKSWDPGRFARVDTLVETVTDAMAMAGVTASDTDLLVLVTCTPLWLKLDQDAFALAHRLGLGTGANVLQVHAGCAGLPRVLSLLADLPYRNVVTLFYNLASPFMLGDNGAINAIYSEHRWLSAAIFADGAAAAVWSRQRDADGHVLYAREAGDPLIHYRGGGAALPPGCAGSEAEMAYAIATGEAAGYYREGMARNHAALDALAPGWLDRVAAYYVHQTSAAAVDELYARLAVPPAKQHRHADRYGNLSSPAALVMAHEDFISGRLAADACVAVSAVGAGPERGAAVFSLSLRSGR